MSTSSDFAVSITMLASLNVQNLATHLDAVDAREHQIEHDEIGMLGPSHLERLVSVARGQDLPALADKVSACEFHHRWLVVDHEDLDRAHDSGMCEDPFETPALANTGGDWLRVPTGPRSPNALEATIDSERGSSFQPCVFAGLAA